MKLDRNKILENLGGDSGLLSKLSRLFLETYPEYCKQISLAIENGDQKSLMVNAHTLKGSIANFLLEDAVNFCRKIEECAKENNFLEARVLNEGLNDFMAEPLKEIRQISEG